MRRRVAFVSGGLVMTAAVAACAPSPRERKSPPMPAAYQGRLAIRAAEIAAPHPPRNLDEELAASNRLATISFDENHDGGLDFDEWIESEFSAFLIYNASHDGKLKYDEFARYYASLHGGALDADAERDVRRRFAEMDSNSKGYLLIDDFHDLAFSSFMLNDVNKDGKVTEAEIAEVAKRGDTGHF